MLVSISANVSTSALAVGRSRGVSSPWSSLAVVCFLSSHCQICDHRSQN